MFDFYNPYDMPDDPSMKDLSDDERLAVAITRGVIFFIIVIVSMAICSLFTGCTTPRAVEEHHHHYYETDTMAVHAQVDRQLTSWHEEMTQFFQHRLEEYSASWSSHEDQKEVISELITVSTDSVGRTIRQEQRSITRDISRELQQQEQRLVREYEVRLRVAVDSVGSVYQQRYDSLAAHVSQMDSTLSIIHHPSSIDNRPWYQRLWDNFRIAFICLLIAVVICLTRGLWWPLIKRLTVNG